MPDYDLAAEDALPSFGDLLGPPADPLAAVARARRDMGLPGGQPPAAPGAEIPGPDVTSLAQRLAC